MFKKYAAIALTSLLGLSAFALTDTASAGFRHNNMWYQNSGWGGDWDNNHRRHHRHHNRGFNSFGVFVSPLIVAPSYGYSSYRRSGSAHVEWCLNRYRSYNPEDNTWVSYSGKVHFCHSPYRY
jgi:hypothetical protein